MKIFAPNLHFFAYQFIDLKTIKSNGKAELNEFISNNLRTWETEYNKLLQDLQFEANIKLKNNFDLRHIQEGLRADIHNSSGARLLDTNQEFFFELVAKRQEESLIFALNLGLDYYNSGLVELDIWSEIFNPQQHLSQFLLNPTSLEENSLLNKVFLFTAYYQPESRSQEKELANSCIKEFFGDSFDFFSVSRVCGSNLYYYYNPIYGTAFVWLWQKEDDKECLADRTFTNSFSNYLNFVELFYYREKIFLVKQASENLINPYLNAEERFLPDIRIKLEEIAENYQYKAENMPLVQLEIDLEELPGLGLELEKNITILKA